MGAEQSQRIAMGFADKLFCGPRHVAYELEYIVASENYRVRARNDGDELRVRIDREPGPAETVLVTMAALSIGRDLVGDMFGSVLNHRLTRKMTRLFNTAVATNDRWRVITSARVAMKYPEMIKVSELKRTAMKTLFYGALGDFDKMVAAANDYVAKAKRESSALQFRASVFVSLGDYGSAITDLTDAITSAPGDARLYEHRILLYLLNSDKSKIAPDLARADRLDSATGHELDRLVKAWDTFSENERNSVRDQVGFGFISQQRDVMPLHLVIDIINQYCTTDELKGISFRRAIDVHASLSRIEHDEKLLAGIPTIYIYPDRMYCPIPGYLLLTDRRLLFEQSVGLDSERLGEERERSFEIPVDDRLDFRVGEIKGLRQLPVPLNKATILKGFPILNLLMRIRHAGTAMIAQSGSLRGTFLAVDGSAEDRFVVAVLEAIEGRES